VVISVGSNKEKEVRKEVICELEKVLGAFSSGNGLDIKYIQDTGFKANKKGIIYFDL
jgi:hypothetical protein